MPDAGMYNPSNRMTHLAGRWLDSRGMIFYVWVGCSPAGERFFAAVALKNLSPAEKTWRDSIDFEGLTTIESSVLEEWTLLFDSKSKLQEASTAGW